MKLAPVAISLAALSLTLALRWLLDPWLGDRQPLSLVFGAVAAAVWVGRWRAAVLVVVSGYLACDWLFIEPRAEFGLRTLPDLIGAAVFLASCTIVIAFGEALHRARDQLLETTRSLESQRRELEHLNRELREADARKDDFVATLAHELRNVLAPMRNAVQIVGMRSSGDPLLTKGARVAERQVSHMARLLEDLLDASRIRKGKVEIRKSPVELGAVIEAAVETSRPNIEAARHTLTLAMPQHPIRLVADSARLAQVFANLLNNAAKYTDPGGRIELSARANERTVEVRVADNGIGFAPHLGASLFAPFQQIDGASARAQGGLGIGLALVRAIVELHGGQVRAHSPGEQRGSEFVVELPLAGE